MAPSRLLPIACLLVAAPAAAHDFWIEPARFDPPVGQALAVRLVVGEGFRGDAVPRPASRLVRFAAVDGGGERPIPGVDGLDPAGVVVVERPGWLAIAYEGNAARLELDAERFERYLQEEGLDAVLRHRAANGAAGRPGRELYSRSAKALLRAGSTTDAAAALPPILGLPLELVPESDPHVVAADQPFVVRLLYRGRGLSDVRVVAMPASDPGAAQSARTNAEGRASFHLDRPGAWLVKAVHMEPAAVGLDADWSSWWASLTFAIAGG